MSLYNGMNGRRGADWERPTIRVRGIVSLLIVAAALVMPAVTTRAQQPPAPGTEATRMQTTQQEARPAAQNPSQPSPGTSPGAERTITLPLAQRSSGQFLDGSGLTVERLVEAGFSRRADLLAARQRLAIAEGRLIQAGLRPNPELEAEYGSARFLAGEGESELDVGVSQVFETGGKRRKRVAVARLDLQRTRAEVLALERQFAAEIRSAYARAVAAGNQLDTLERLIVINEELVRVTNERLKEGDVAPLELGLVSVETDRLRAQVSRTRAELESEIISLRALAGFEMTEPLRIAPLPDRPPRLDLNVSELTEIALRERPDLQAARLGEELGSARIRLAESQAVPNIAASVRYTRENSVTDIEGIGDIVDKDNVLTFGVALEIPVFNKNQGEIASAVGERTEAVRQREFLEATIRRDVALAHRRYRAAAEALVLYAMRILPQSQKNVETVRAAYGLGEFSIFEVLQQQQRLVESETGYNEALRDYYTALAELERALGTPLPANGFAPAQTSVLPDGTPQPDAGALRRAILSLKATRQGYTGLTTTMMSPVSAPQGHKDNK
ncbi:MAG: TolC family protein [Acidobacteria bacterium]|nr:TolC family protein [Acidobacteriota bacterium]